MSWFASVSWILNDLSDVVIDWDTWEVIFLEKMPPIINHMDGFSRGDIFRWEFKLFKWDLKCLNYDALLFHMQFQSQGKFAHLVF